MSLDLNEVVRLLAAGNIPSPRLEARILLEHVGGSPFAEVDGEAEQKLRRLVERRLAHVPLDKLLGRREFYKNDFIVSEDVLTPRPDTEILVETAVGLVCRNGLKRILDLGTGSGCIILSILDDCPQACRHGHRPNRRRLWRSPAAMRRGLACRSGLPLSAAAGLTMILCGKPERVLI